MTATDPNLPFWFLAAALIGFALGAAFILTVLRFTRPRRDADRAWRHAYIKDARNL